jgi:hypothetical protein
MVAEIKEIHHKHDQPLKILLQKNTAGGFNWEIHYTGKTLEEIMPVIEAANNKMQAKFGGKEKK